MLLKLIIVAIPIALAAQTDPGKPPSLLNYAITGASNSSSPAENATYAMEHLEVQRLLLDVAASSRDRQHVEALYADPLYRWTTCCPTAPCGWRTGVTG
jgi:hypothetical protein